MVELLDYCDEYEEESQEDKEIEEGEDLAERKEEA